MRKHKIIFMSAVLVIICVVYFHSIFSYYENISPIKGENLIEVQSRTNFKNIQKTEQGNRIYYVITGELPPTYILASGAPVYIFDSNGLLVEWIKDSGELHSDEEKWLNSYAVEISEEELLKEVAEN